MSNVYLNTKNPARPFMPTCKYCSRPVELTDEGWVDPQATGDDSLWYLVCDENDTFTAEHEVDA